MNERTTANYICLTRVSVAHGAAVPRGFLNGASVCVRLESKRSQQRRRN